MKRVIFISSDSSSRSIFHHWGISLCLQGRFLLQSSSSGLCPYCRYLAFLGQPTQRKLSCLERQPKLPKSVKQATIQNKRVR